MLWVGVDEGTDPYLALAPPILLQVARALGGRETDTEGGRCGEGWEKGGQCEMSGLQGKRGKPRTRTHSGRELARENEDGSSTRSGRNVQAAGTQGESKRR